MMFPIILILFSFQFFSTYSYAEEVILQIPDGKIKGRTEVTITNTKFYLFQGIPYAQPPINELRFQAPQPVHPWNGILDATYEKNVCYQVSGDRDDESEDCLFMNVYTPKDPSLNSSLPVMLLIYGGGFVNGASDSAFFGPEHLMDYDVIFISFNYRLGPFGFFTTGDSVIPGNAGLKDQQLALQWVNKNVRYFGGDPEKVTLFGQSAGGASTTYHLLSKKSKGLFRAAISQSGSFLSPWAYQRNQREISFHTAGYIDPSFNTENRSSEEFLAFMQSVSARDLDAASFKLESETEGRNGYIQIQHGFFYAPVIEHDHEGAFISNFMFETLKSGDINRVPLLMGYNSEENWFYMDDMQVMKWMTQFYDNNHTILVPADMNIKDQVMLAEAADAIKVLYLQDSSFVENPRRLINFASDQSFVRSLIKHAELQSRFTDVYFYKFSYSGVLGGYAKESVVGFSDEVRHGEEVSYLFRRNSLPLNTTDLSKFPPQDILVHKRLIRLYTDFAKTTNPTPKQTELMENIILPPVKPDNFQYLDIGSYSLLRKNPREEIYRAWKAIYDQYAQPPLDTY